MSELVDPTAMRGLTMTSEQWLNALADAWWLGHRDVCTDCNCPERVNPYRVARAHEHDCSQHACWREVCDCGERHE